MTPNVSSTESGDETRSSNYEYVATRVRARKAQLFDDDDYRKLVRMSPNEIARFMEENGYDREMNRLGTRYSGVDLVEYSLYDNMSRNFRDIVSWSEGSLRTLVVGYLRTYDAWNVKTVIRGVYTGATQEEMEADLIPAGELDVSDLEAAMNAESVEQAVEELGDTAFADALDDALREYQDTDLLMPLENAVDRVFYERLLAGQEGGSTAREAYLDYLRTEIDLLNVRNALRAAGSEELDVEDYYVDGGELFTRDELSRLVGNQEELVEALRDSRYAEEFSDAIDALEEGESLVEFDRALDKLLMGFAQRMTYRYPISIAPVISYILTKEREVKNIRGIARGKEAGLEVEEIEKEVVI